MTHLLPLLMLATTAEPFRFPEAKHAAGELRYVNGIPVLTVAGTPAEIGEQVGVLALKSAPGFLETVKAAVKNDAGDVGWAFAVTLSKGVYAKFPAAFRTELEAMAKAGGVDPEVLIVANCLPDVGKLIGCAGLCVEPTRSATGGPLLGRNFDAHPVGRLAELGLVVVYRKAGAIPFAAVTYPGILMSGSAMNAAGLAVGSNSVGRGADGAPAADPAGEPMVVVGRRVFEACRTVGELEAFVRNSRPMTAGIVPAVDATTATVVEVTPRTVAVRPAASGLAFATNHFVTDKLRVPCGCDRFPKLEKATALKKLAVADVAKLLHDADQGHRTLQTMVFEPAAKKLHVAFGDGKKSAAAGKLAEIDLTKWLAE